MRICKECEDKLISYKRKFTDFTCGICGETKKTDRLPVIKTPTGLMILLPCVCGVCSVQHGRCQMCRRNLS